MHNNEFQYELWSQHLFKASIFLLVVAIGYLNFHIFIMKNSNTQNSEIDEMIKKEVAAIIGISEEDKPYLATVSDPDALREQPFFAEVSREDKVLIYPNLQKVILYNPRTKKIINTSSIRVR